MFNVIMLFSVVSFSQIQKITYHVINDTLVIGVKYPTTSIPCRLLLSYGDNSIFSFGLRFGEDFYYCANYGANYICNESVQPSETKYISQEISLGIGKKVIKGVYIGTDIVYSKTTKKFQSMYRETNSSSVDKFGFGINLSFPLNDDFGINFEQNNLTGSKIGVILNL